MEDRVGAQGVLGLVPTHWWVELGPGPSGGQGSVQRWLWAREVFSLCADRWGCVPTQLVAWLEASQPRCLEAVVWGQVLVLMSQRTGSTVVPSSARVHVVEAAPKNGYHQCLCPQGSHSRPPPPHPEDSPRPAGRSGPGSYQISAFALGPRA